MRTHRAQASRVIVAQRLLAIGLSALGLFTRCAPSVYSTGKSPEADPIAMSATLSCGEATIPIPRLTGLVAAAFADAGYRIAEADSVAGVVSTEWKSSPERITACELDETVSRRVRHDVKITGPSPTISIFPQTQYYADPVWDWCADEVLEAIEHRLVQRLPAGVSCETAVKGAGRTTASEFAQDDQATGDKPPEPVHLAAPQIPRNVVQGTMVSGMVTVRMLVDDEGRVRIAIPLGGSEQLRASVLEAAMHSRFKPALRGDRPVSAWVCAPYDFRFI